LRRQGTPGAEAELLQAPPSESGKNLDISGAKSAAEVLQVAEQNLEDFGLLQTLACLRKLVELKGSLTDELSSSKALGDLVKSLGSKLAEAELSNRAFTPGIVDAFMDTVSAIEELAEAAPVVRQLEAVVRNRTVEEVEYFRPTALVDLLHQDYLRQSPEVLDAYATAFERKMRRLSPDNLADLAALYAKEGAFKQPLFAALGQTAARKADLFGHQTLSKLFIAFATVGYRHDELFSTATKLASQNIGVFGPRSLSGMAWSHAMLGLENKAFIKTVAKAAMWQVENLMFQDLAHVLWALASLGLDSEPMVEAAPQHLLEKIDTARAAEVSLVAWAYVRMDVLDHTLMEALAKRALETSEDFDLRGLRRLAWSFTTSGLYDAPLLDMVASRSAQLIEASVPETLTDVSTIMRSMMASNRQYPGFVKATADLVVTRADAFAVDDLADLVWSFAELGESQEQAMEAAAASALKRVDEFKQPQNVIDLVRAYAKLSIRNDELLQAALVRAKDFVPKFTEQELGYLVEEVLRLDIKDEALMQAIVDAAVLRAMQVEASTLQLATFQQVLAAALGRGVEVTGLARACEAVYFQGGRLPETDADAVRHLLQLADAVPENSMSAAFLEKVRARALELSVAEPADA